MISQPVKIGDDTAVVIPSAILAQLGIREGDTLEIALNKDKMEIKKMVLKTSTQLTLKILRRIELENLGLSDTLLVSQNWRLPLSLNYR